MTLDFGIKNINYFAFVVLALVIYLSFQMYRVYALNKNLRIDVRDTKHGPFDTRIYNLLINGVRTTDGILSIDRREFTGNNVELFANDVLRQVVNMIVLSGHPYGIRFHALDKDFYYFVIDNKCSMFPLPACAAGLDAEALITKFVHVLGMRV